MRSHFCAKPFRLDAAERDKALPDDFPKRWPDYARNWKRSRRSRRPTSRAVVVQEDRLTPHEGFQDVACLPAGNHTKPGKIVARGSKAIAGASPAIRESAGNRPVGSPILKPAPARVMVNRIWQHHLARAWCTSANFGAMGSVPATPSCSIFSRAVCFVRLVDQSHAPADHVVECLSAERGT
jgi:hypothetical protein